MAMTLLESVKYGQMDSFRRGIIEEYISNAPLLQIVPFLEVTGSGYHYTREGTLPGVAFRGVNQSYSESTGIINPQFDPLTILGGDIDVDVAIIKMMGTDIRTRQTSMKLKAMAHTWLNSLIKGDSTTNSYEFDGLQARVTGTQLFADTTTPTDGGDPLSLGILDAAIDAVDNPTHLVMSKAMRRRFTQAARSTTVSGTINYEPDEFGRPILRYGELPIIIADANGQLFPVLAFNEVGPGGTTATATSVYVVSINDDGLTGIQNSPPEARDLGELDVQAIFRTRTEWLNGIACLTSRCVARYWGISDAAIVA